VSTIANYRQATIKQNNNWMSKVKQQHYVWRHYLRSWANDEIIWAYFKRIGKIEKSNLMGVAQERYFYKLIDLTESEELFLKNYIDKNSPHAVKDLNFDFLRLFTYPYRSKKQFEKNPFLFVDKELFDKEIEEIEINLMEWAHGEMESFGHKILKYRTLDDLKTIENDNNLFEAILFLCFQFVRTKNMKNSALSYFKGKSSKELAQKTWSILSYVTATSLAYKIVSHPNLKFVFLENKSTNFFITGDQPVFNLLVDKVNENCDVLDLEFYYPITPSHALLVHFRNDQGDKFLNQSADEILIGYLNKKVFENSDFFVFANNKEQLEILHETNLL
jgi:Protein of unknown function (DUF4238)